MQNTDAIPPSQQNCCAIVVTFHPDTLFFERLQRLCDVFKGVVVIDNGSDAVFRQQLYQKQTAALVVIQNDTNQGLAKALNQGLAYAIAQQFAWVMTFDQDTLIYPNILQMLLLQYQTARIKPLMMGCNYWHEALNRPLLNPKAGDGCIERKTLISSGTLLSLTLPPLMGYFREDYFIDSIDHEYSLRARRHGCRLVISTQVLMRHVIGQAETFERIEWLRIPEHSALRKYYITRNCLTTAAHYVQQEPLWGGRQLLRLGVEFLAIVVYERQKKQKIAAMCLGAWHALTGRLGELKNVNPEWLA
ncbi:MAG: glycosyltransferase [Methylococcaceae bacterium]